MKTAVLDTICPYRTLIAIGFAFNILYVIMGLILFPLQPPGSETYYITIIMVAFAILGLAILSPFMYWCRHRGV